MRLASKLAAIACLFLSQCVSNKPDPQFQAMASAAESNPRKDDIVGMWHALGNEAGVGNVLFQRDGTYIARSKVLDQVYEGGSTWNYMGNGLWTVRYKHITTYYRLSRGKLLQSLRPSFTAGAVLVRVEG